MSNLVDHARRELAAIGETDEEFRDTILDMVERFSKFGHSGGSAAVMTSMLVELLQFKNLMPLTDDPAEWHKHDMVEEPFWQNIRNGEAFSHDGGKTYYLLSEGSDEPAFKNGSAHMHVSRSHQRLRLVQEASD